MRSKEIERSLEKSTEKYFKQEPNYRILKTNNDIESMSLSYSVYVSTVKNPSINRQSNITNTSTLNTSDRHNSIFKNSTTKNEYMEYEFDFKDNDLQG